MTRDGVRDLLEELEAVYRELDCVSLVDKLIIDIIFDIQRFIQHLGPVAVEVRSQYWQSGL